MFDCNVVQLFVSFDQLEGLALHEVRKARQIATKRSIKYF